MHRPFSLMKLHCRVQLFGMDFTRIVERHSEMDSIEAFNYLVAKFIDNCRACSGGLSDHYQLKVVDGF